MILIQIDVHHTTKKYQIPTNFSNTQQRSIKVLQIFQTNPSVFKLNDEIYTLIIVELPILSKKN
jgi:hypothetical protein